MLGEATTPILLQCALTVPIAACHPDGAICRFGDPVSCTGSAMDRRRFKRYRRFHDEMQPSIRPDQQREVVRLGAVV